MTNNETIVVAGATGYLGRHVVAALAGRGRHVTALVRRGKSVPHASRTLEVDVTDPSTLKGVFEGATHVFSALGITRQKDHVTYEDIEYTANRNLLEEALRAGVRGFGVISVARPQAFRDLAILSSRERFIAELRQAPIRSTVVRATGFFSDMREIFDMAASGRVWLVGPGQVRINPVHGSDLAEASIDALLAGEETVEVGGPDVFTWNELAQVAFEALGTPPRVSHVPLGVAKFALGVVRPFNRRAYDVGSFIVRGSQNDALAPCRGTHHLRTFFEDCARARAEAQPS